MAFHNDSNQKRVAKMCEILDLIEKSAVSNDATKEEVAETINQLLQRTDRYRDIQPTSAPDSAIAKLKDPARRIGVSAPRWASVLDMAIECSLSELQGAMAVYLSRLDEHFADIQTEKRG